MNGAPVRSVLDGIPAAGCHVDGKAATAAVSKWLIGIRLILSIVLVFGDNKGMMRLGQLHGGAHALFCHRLFGDFGRGFFS